MESGQLHDLVQSHAADLYGISRRRKAVLDFGSDLLPAWEILIALKASNSALTLDDLAASVDLTVETTGRWVSILEVRDLICWQIEAQRRTITLTQISEGAIAAIICPELSSNN